MKLITDLVPLEGADGLLLEYCSVVCICSGKSGKSPWRAGTVTSPGSQVNVCKFKTVHPRTLFHVRDESTSGRRGTEHTPLFVLPLSLVPQSLISAE